MSRHIEVRRLTLFAVAIALFVSSCGGSTAAIIGEWQVTNADLIFEFFQDNTVTLAQAGRTFTGQYKYIDNENIRLDVIGDLGPRAMVLKDVKQPGDELAFTLDGKALQLTRVTGEQAQASQPKALPPQASSNMVELLCREWAVQSALMGNVSESLFLRMTFSFQPDGSVEIGDSANASVSKSRWELTDNATRLSLYDTTGQLFGVYTVDELTTVHLRLTSLPGATDPRTYELVLVPKGMVTIVPPTPTSPPTVSSGKTYNIEVSEFAFSPAKMSVGWGQKITVDLVNRGTVEHHFIVDELGVNVKVSPGEKTQFTFTPRTSGTFKYYCNLAGHRAAGEEGQLVVSP